MLNLAVLRVAACLAYIMGVGARLAMSGQAQAQEPASPGILAGDLLYVSGQGAQDAQGRVPREPVAQIRQRFSKVRTIVEAAGLTTEHVVYVQVYLTDYKSSFRSRQPKVRSSPWSEALSGGGLQ
jgi:enamine deaminase RidA (YjgF/YER057c/UK114 family)